jgi:3-oxoacyl-[acyl-carrier protein] reductase
VALGRELAPHGITVNAVAPGAIDAGIVAELPEDARARLRALIPIGRMGTADEVADLVAYLAGPQAGFITGQTIVIDGGATIPYIVA